MHTFIHIQYMYMYVIHIYAYVSYAHMYICTYIQYTEQTRDYPKPKMCTSTLFFSEGRLGFLLEDVNGSADPVSFSTCLVSSP